MNGDDYVESEASSHFCLFAAGSAEDSVDKQDVLNKNI